MSTQYADQSTYLRSQRVTRLRPEVECPDLATFTLRYEGVAQCGEYPGFQGQGMRTRCRIASKIHAPNEDDPNHEWDGLDVSRWMSPVLHDERAHGFKLARAIDPSFELEAEEFEDEEGNIGIDYDFVEQMARYEGKLYTSLVGPNKNGYPEVQGDPAPYIPPEQRRRRQRPAVVATVVEPENQIEEGDDDF
jgi:hypothetical protein